MRIWPARYFSPMTRLIVCARLAFTNWSRLWRKIRKMFGKPLSLLDVTRTLERLADHATNIAEDVLFHVKGIDVRHHSAPDWNTEPG